MPSAWIILFINRRNGRVMGADIFSEPSPTVFLNNTATVPLLERKGDTYAIARAAAMRALASPAYDWIGPLDDSGGSRVEREWMERDRQRVVELTAEVDRLRKELAAATAGGSK